MIELLIVISIITIISLIAVTNYNVARRQSKIAKAQNDISSIALAIGILGIDTLVWPNHQLVEEVNSGNANEICADGCTYSLSDSEVGIAATDGTYDNWSGPYMVIVNADPWGNAYFFDTDYRVTQANLPCNGGMTCVDAVVVGSYGPDGVGNNQYNADDVIKIIKK